MSFRPKHLALWFVVLACSAPAVAAREVVVEAHDFRFEPSEIRVDVGESVTFVLHNEGTNMHNLGGDFGRTDTLARGDEGELTVTFDEAGTFEFWCSVAGHREQGMEGTVVVGDAGDDESSPGVAAVGVLLAVALASGLRRRRG